MWLANRPYPPLLYLHLSLPVITEVEIRPLLQPLDEQVRFWTPASHAFWAIWGIVQGRDDLETGNEEPEFDYLNYSKCRMALFREEIDRLGIRT